MIFGTCDLKDGALHTHRDSYLLSSLTTVSARRVFALPGMMIASLIGGFCLAFRPYCS